MKSILLIFFLSLVLNSAAKAENLLKTVEFHYKVRTINIDENLEFNGIIPFSKINHFEMISGNEWSDIQPVGLFQNVSDKVLTFKTKFEIFNLDSNRIVYRRNGPVSKVCLSLDDEHAKDCTGDPNIRVRYCEAQKNGNDYVVNYLPFPGENNLTGITPGGFVEVQYPPFQSNEFLPAHTGNCKVSLIIVPIEPETELPIGETDFTDDTLSAELFLRPKLCSELYYPNSGDTITPGKNYFLGLGKDESQKKYILEYSKTEDFSVIAKTVNRISATNLILDEFSHYFWRMKGYTQDNTCYSEPRHFYTAKSTSVDETVKISMLLHPNPATDYIEIQPSEDFEPSEGCRVKIFDMFGIEVMSESIPPLTSNHRMNIEKLPAGVYFIKIGDKVEKFVKM